MEIKSKVFKRKSGKMKDKWIARIEYFDDTLGKRRFIERQFDKKSDAVKQCKTSTSDLEKTSGKVQDGERMTFADLAAICEKNFYQPAVIVEGRKIAGVRSYDTAQNQIATLTKFFGKRLIKSIATESLTDYKLWRLKNGSLNPTVNKDGKKKIPVKLSTINRELSTMRRMMRYAFGKGWILKDIFFNAKVIEMSAEIERTRLLTYAEEVRLIASCQGERLVPYKRRKRGTQDEYEQIEALHKVDNPHLKAMIILALDSGMRRGEIFKLQWNDIDFENNLIRILGTNTKTERERIAPLSQRAKDELEKLKKISNGGKPFPDFDIKRSFATAKRLAGIDDLHFHDLRRSAITRWIQNDIPIALAGKLAGHSQLQTTMKHYTSTDAAMVSEISEKINAFQQFNDAKTIESEMLN